ncbi:MAG: DMT family transporter [Gammaproteobacteria bacterium]|nr:DMT family transporter [Gammaproteobacteria bacterium]MCY4275224.1 DMT family transporter [Gammaproteobacteria bacterium]
MLIKNSATLRGGLLLIGGMSLIGLVDNFIRFIIDEGGVWQFYLMRAVFNCLLIAGYIAYWKRSFHVNHFWWVVLRSMLMATAILVYFIVISFLPIAIAGAILFTSPIFLLIFSALVFKTRIGAWRILAVIFGFIGIILVLKPNPQDFSIYTLVPALAGMMYALGQLVTRHKCADEDTLVLLFGFFLGTGLLGLMGIFVLGISPFLQSVSAQVPFVSTGWVSPSGEFLFWTMIQGIGSLFAVLALIRAYQIAEPTYIAVFEYSFIVFAGFWGWVIWKEVLDAAAITGILAIIAAGVVISIRSAKSEST